MLKIPPVNNYSWFPLNFHSNVESKELTKLNIGKKIQLRYDLKKKKPIVLRTKFIEKKPSKKIEKIDSLKKIFSKIKTNSKKELLELVENKVNFIYEVVTK